VDDDGDGLAPRNDALGPRHSAVATMPWPRAVAGAAPHPTSVRRTARPTVRTPRSPMTRLRPDRELDACGIGFVADAQGRSSRSIVAAALDGLANVKHRGALAADARSGDGSGLLLPIPAALFGEGHGVVSLFARGPEARPAVTAAAEQAGLQGVEGRTPPTADDALGDFARRSRPDIVQVVVTRPSGSGGGTDGVASEEDERVAYRLRRRIGA